MIHRTFSNDEFKLLQDLIQFAAAMDYFTEGCLDDEDLDDKEVLEKLEKQKKLFPYIASIFEMEEDFYVKIVLKQLLEEFLEHNENIFKNKIGFLDKGNIE